MRFCDITGCKFGRLTAIKYIGSDGGITAAWEFFCDCGNTININGANVRHGRTKSCGCLKIETKANFKHGMSHTSIHNIWMGIIDRCTNKNSKAYKHYGGRGIGVCDRWVDSFDNFHKDMGDRPKNHSIDRINVDGNYEPSNCKWSTQVEQVRNRRNTINFTLNGVSKPLADWCEELDTPYYLAHQRISKGKSGYDVFKPKRGCL